MGSDSSDSRRPATGRLKLVSVADLASLTPPPPPKRQHVHCSVCGARLCRVMWLTVCDAYRGDVVPRVVPLCEATDAAHEPSGSYGMKLDADARDMPAMLWHVLTKPWAQPIIGEIGWLVALWLAGLSYPPGQRR